MTYYLNKTKDTIRKIWLNVFWKNPPHLWALKVTVSIAFLLIIAELVFAYFWLDEDDAYEYIKNILKNKKEYEVISVRVS